MKKIYQEPKIKVVRVNHHQMLCSSPAHPESDIEQIDILDDKEEDVLSPIF